MALSRLSRLAWPAGLVAAATSVAALVLFVIVVGSGTISQAADSATFYAPTLAALVSTLALAVALIAVYVRHAADLGGFGLAGFLVALVGTMLGAGAYWTYVFVLPYLAERAPGLADSSSGSVLAGFVISFLVMGVGWLLVALAALRARIWPRWCALLLTFGALLTIVPMPSRTLVLAVAVACVGHVTRRETRDAADSGHPGNAHDERRRRGAQGPAVSARRR